MFDHGIGDRGNEVLRDLGAIHLFKMGLYIANRHSSRVELQNLVVKTAPAGLATSPPRGIDSAWRRKYNEERPKKFLGDSV